MMYKKSVIFLMGLLLAASIKGMEPANIRISASTGQGLTLTCTPANVQSTPIYKNSILYHRLDFKNASSGNDPGEPAIPDQIIVIGIPPEGQVSISVAESEYTDKSGVRILPVPEMREIDKMPSEHYFEGPGYKLSGFQPGQLYTSEEPGMMGKYRILRIHLFPVQFDASQNRIRQYSKITLRITFHGNTSPVPGWEKERRNKSFYQKALLNYTQAKKWPVIPASGQILKAQKATISGERYKIPVSLSTEGIFKMTGSFLSQNGINIASIDPATLKIYNNGGQALPRDIQLSRPDSLIENPILTSGFEDGRFDENDYILYYGKGVSNWQYDLTTEEMEHYNNVYTDQNVYWLAFNDNIPGKRLSSQSGNTDVDNIITTAVQYDFIEHDYVNYPGKGGIRWYGSQFAPNDTRNYTLPFHNPVPGMPISFRVQVKGATSGIHTFQMYFNGQSLSQFSFSGTTVSTRSVISETDMQSENTLTLKYTANSDASMTYMDWIEWAYTSYLRAEDGVLIFYSPLQAGNLEYRLSGFDTQPLVWDVTNTAQITQMEVRSENQEWVFIGTGYGNEPRKYIAVQNSAFLSPEAIAQDEPSNLRDFTNDADMVIVTHKDFYDQAGRLKDHRETNDSLTVQVVDIQDVYDEFSWGLFDPTAIRDMLHYAHSGGWQKPPAYLLLFGDGDFDYRNKISSDDKNWIPPFERDANTDTGARATDDWYTYVLGSDTEMDLSVGRFPVRSTAEAQVVVDKIIGYENNPDFGDWRTLITLVGDDEKGAPSGTEETTHIGANEDIANYSIPASFNLRKIYLTEYPEEIITEGRRKPKAEDDLVDQINKGTLIVNFIGHGNNELWAHERVFYIAKDLARLNNRNRLPLIFAATCDFARYDDPMVQSFAEELINAYEKGCFAIIAASRFCVSYANEALDRQFIKYLLNEFGPSERMGDALRLAKIQVSNTYNNEMYHLLGDPSMRLGMPRYHAAITDMDPDSLKALSLVQIRGVYEQDGQPWNSFSGKINLKAFDSKKPVVYTTAENRTIDYILPGNALFRGETSSENEFEIAFIVPKDISYGGNTGRLSVYFYNDETDGMGYQNNIAIGGSASLIDQEGPYIGFSFDDNNHFLDGGLVTENPELTVKIEDEKSGINITGEIGHKIILTLDETAQEDVTNYFQYDEGSYLSGSLTYALSGLEPGMHTLSLKAWDNANNSSSQSISFEVVPGDELKIDRVLNYPNPFDYSVETDLTFQLNQDAEVDIKIFTLSGRLIKRLDGIWGNAGFNCVHWDGRDEAGDELANGVYLYQIQASTQWEGSTIRQKALGRAMIMR